MKKKIKHYLLMLFVLMVALNCAIPMNIIAQAQSTISVQVDRANGFITVTGNISSGKSHQKAAVMVSRPGKTFTSGADIGSVAAAVYQVNTGDGGAYSYTFSLDTNNSDSGDYTARITGANILSAQTTFFFISKKGIEAAVQSINDANTINDLAAIIDGVNNKVRELGLPYGDNATYYNLFKNMQNDAKTKVYQLLLSHDGSFENDIAFCQGFDKDVSLTFVNIAGTGKVVQDNLGTLTNPLGLTLSGPYTAILKNDNTDRLEVWNNLIGKDYKNVGDLQQGFKDSLIVAAVRYANTWADMKTVLAALCASYNDFVLDMSNTGDFARLSGDDQINVYKTLTNMNAQITDVNGLKAMFENAISTVSQKPVKNNGPSGGGGGGGGGGKVTNVVVSNPEPAEPPKATFPDINEYSWAADSITALNGKGVLQGFEDGTFRPSNNVTREEFVKMLVTAFSLQDASATVNFSDVNKDGWSYNYIASGYKAGIINGINDESFGIGKEITRQEMAVMAYRAVKNKGISLPQTSQLQTFTDESKISPYAVECVKAMQQAGIINGVGDGRFAPEDFANRAEASKIIFGLLQENK